MPRPIRIHYPGAIYHVFSRGIEKRPIFYQEFQWEMFVDLLRELKHELSFQLFAFCLMPNHFHFLIQVDTVPLSYIMQQLKSRFAQTVNIQQERVGPLFQGRYGSRLCANDRYLLTVIRYIHLNPVEASLTATPEAWPWSGHCEYLDETRTGLLDVNLPLSMFSDDRGKAQQAYLQYIYEGLQPGANAPTYRGMDAAIAPNEMRQRRQCSDNGSAVDLDKLLLSCSSNDVSASSILAGDRGRPTANARKRFIYAALDAGRSAVEIAAFLGCTDALISKARRERRQDLLCEQKS